MLIHIKNMVCDRCQMIVRQQLQNLGFTVKRVALGKAENFTRPRCPEVNKEKHYTVYNKKRNFE